MPLDTEPMVSTGDKLAELRARKAAKEAKLEEERNAAEVLRLELEERFEAETGGPIDRTFTIVDVSDLGEGFVVMRLGDDVIWNTFKASKMNVVDTDAFVVPCVLYPSKDEYRKLAKRRAFVPERCAGALASLYGVKIKADQGK